MIPEIPPYNNYSGDGATTQFDFDFYIEDGSQLKVEHINENGITNTLQENIDYSINEIGNENGSFIVFPKAGSKYSLLSNAEIISLQLTLPASQESEYGKSSELDFKSLEYSFDYLTRLIQILNRGLERAVKVQEGSEATSDELLDIINTKVMTAEQAVLKATEEAASAYSSAVNAGEKATIATVKAEEASNQAQIATLKAQEVSSKANINLDNLSAIGQAILDKKSSIDLDNLSAIGQQILDRKVEVEALLEQNGYAKFTWKDDNKISKMLCLQWGKIFETKAYSGNGGVSGEIKFPTAFNQTCYLVNGTCIEYGDIIQITSVSNTNFQYIVFDRLADVERYKKFYWLAIGF